MQSTPSLDQFIPIPQTVTKAAYQAFQDGKSYFGVAHKTISDRLTEMFLPGRDKQIKPLSLQTLALLQKLRNQLIETDWQDAENKIYPVSLLFENPWEDFFRYYPAVWLDMPKIWERVRNKEYQQFDPELDREGYPRYYLQNFHYQTDGYLSDWSANLYDLQVEILFNGTADLMRRRILKPLKEGLSNFAPQPMRVLDVACGTGRTLKMIRATLPKASLFGVDLSPSYLRKANLLLSENPGELPQLAQANAEELPYLDNYFHGVSNVFLFHELPAEARQRVIEECFRVIQPGGVFVICDSIQRSDSPEEFQVMMDNFPTIFHEPYYKHYVTDNLVERLEEAGFQDIKTENHFVSKYWVARKPA
ncbi:methyltransferase domain-containing protein [Candidatus Gracilibacteria bacterium]|nr:methyltransferase domain-containing protein [Candidatus Gracilibacteria bacterium]NJM86044.1 methyltransferase domain-containing protein [Hydrococcus sp. RU_2_2]NJP22093.1 methyltransferase domain-containing protein [Hydrococcus sp. CRU_1_1]